MKFSVVIPTYNRADFIDKTINSILNQSYQKFEILVIDDGSTDNTEDIVKNIKDPRIFYYKKENAERGAARNYGAKKASGDFINFFDSDDLAYSNHLETAKKIIKTNENLNVFHLGYDIKDLKGNLERKSTTIDNINKQLVCGNLLSCNGVFIKKEIALENPFNETRALSASEDYLLWLQLASQYKIAHNNIVTTTVIEHDDRSVLNFSVNKLIERNDSLINAINDSQLINLYYKNNIKKIIANADAYVSIHLMLSNHKKTSLKYYFKAILRQPALFFSRKSLAIIKRFFI